MENLNSIHSNPYYFHSNYENDINVDEDEHLLDESQCVKRQRGKNKTYIVFKKYPKEVDLKEVVNDLKNYGWIKERIIKDKCKFKCKRGCPKKGYCTTTADGIVAYESTDEHFHKHETFNLPSQTVQVIKECFQTSNQKPSQIQQILQTKALPSLTTKQIYNLKSRITKKKMVPFVQEISEWCQANSQVPDDVDEVFCGSFECKTRKNNTLKYLRAFLTTIRLISFMRENSNLLATDSTRKSNWKGFSLILMGTIDASKQFHPFGLQLSFKANKKDFCFGFKALSTLCRNLNDHLRYRPSKLLADNSSTITKAFKKQFKCFPNKRIVCWTHALRNWDGRSKVLSDSVRSHVRSDLVMLQQSPNDSAFEIGKLLLKIKWNHDKVVTDALERFFNEWSNGWYEGYSIGDPSSNLGLEANYRLLKDEEMNNEPLDAFQFLNKLKTQVIKEWSTSRCPKIMTFNQNGDEIEVENINFKHWCNEPKIENKDWSNAYQWSLLGKKFLKYVLSISDSVEIVLCVAKDDKMELNSTVCSEYFSHLENCESEHFDEFMTKIFSIDYIRFNENNWKMSVCSCNMWNKNSICNHVIHIAVKEKLTSYPDIDLSSNTKGRRTKPLTNTNRLLQQPSEIYFNNNLCYTYASPSFSDASIVESNNKRIKINEDFFF